MARALPPPTPEGALIRRVRESLRPRVSIPAAAKLAEVSEATWGNVERGYRTAKGGENPIPVVGSASTVAHMAYAVGIAPADLEKAGRADAAGVLREIQGPDEVEVMDVPSDHGLVMIPVSPDMPEEDREELRRWGIQMARYLGERRQVDSTRE
ncbi:hypothetical protein [Streptosporangium sp. NPDC048865]|uniref:hypothetical protein n=1 Tax=Streptosporangium sp. NPDC048865 TaxID=3155766 RepID=UPI0034399F2F